MNEHPQKASNIDINSMYIGNRAASVVKPRVQQKKIDHSKFTMFFFHWANSGIFIGQNAIFYIITYSIKKTPEFAVQLFFFDAIVLRFQHFVATMFVQFLQNYEYNHLSVLTTIFLLIELLTTCVMLLVWVALHYCFGMKYSFDYSEVLAAFASALYITVSKMCILSKKDVRACGMTFVCFMTLSGISMMYQDVSYFLLYTVIYLIGGVMLYCYSYLNNERLFTFYPSKLLKQPRKFCQLILPALVVGFGGILGNGDYLALVIYEIQLFQADMSIVLYTAWLQVLGRLLQFETVYFLLIKISKMGKGLLLFYALIAALSVAITCYYPLMFQAEFSELKDYTDYVYKAFAILFAEACSTTFLGVIMRYKVYGVQYLVAFFNLLVCGFIILVARTMTIDTTFHEAWIYIAGYSNSIIGFAGFLNLFIQQFRHKDDDE